MAAAHAAVASTEASTEVRLVEIVEAAHLVAGVPVAFQAASVQPPEDESPRATSAAVVSAPPSLTDEQRARIARNKAAAQARRGRKDSGASNSSS